MELGLPFDDLVPQSWVVRNGRRTYLAHIALN
jgi:hypothetical protein